MVKLIEMVCTANNGRSPVAELIAQNHLVTLGADSEYRAVSSGTMVDDIANGNISENLKINIIASGIDEGVYNSQQLEEINCAYIDEDDEVIDRYFTKRVEELVAQEVQHKQESLEYFKIPGSVKQGHDQTVEKLDSIAVFSMDKGNLGRIVSIYRESEHFPIIGVLSRFVTGDPDAEIADAFGSSGQEGYFKRVEQMLVEVPKAVNMIVRA